jgi:methionyl-tRNA formyltransferase
MARVVFMGSPSFAVPALHCLADRCDVAAALCQPDRPGGRGRKLQQPPVKVAAQARGITVLQPPALNEAWVHETLRQLAPDLCVVAAYGLILPRPILEIPRFGCVNIHASLLPRYRGAAPVARAILAGEVSTGVCLMSMERGLDTGPIYARANIAVGDLPCDALTARLADLGAALLQSHLPRLLTGTLAAEPQDASGATYAHKLTKDEGALDFRLPALALARAVRAFHPWPGTYTFVGGQRLGVTAAYEQSAQGEPGSVLSVDPVTVGCGRGSLTLIRVKPAGRSEMDAVAWARGQRLAPGQRLD